MKHRGKRLPTIFELQDANAERILAIEGRFYWTDDVHYNLYTAWIGVSHGLENPSSTVDLDVEGREIPIVSRCVQ